MAILCTLFDSNYPITEQIHAQELSIPMNQVVSTPEAEEVVRNINSFGA